MVLRPPKPPKPKVYKAVLRNDLPSFTRKAFHIVSPGDVYLHNWHIDAISHVLRLCMEGKIKRLLITMPPRYLKSICGTVAFPAFILGHDPSKKIITVSYSNELSLKHAADTRLLMNADWFKTIFPQTVLSVQKNTQSEFVTSQNGGRYATSVGGSMTGLGGDIIIIDDPHKADEATSDLKRKQVIDWFNQVALTRLDDKKNGVIIVIMQRLHQEDLAGHLMEKGGWDLLNLSAIAEEDAYIPLGNGQIHHRSCGDVLHPERESLEDLMIRKHEMGEYAFAAQYQQRPAPLGGGIVKWQWFEQFESPIERMYAEYVVQSWDIATTANESSDWSVCTTAYFIGGNIYIVDIYREKLEFPQLKNKVYELAKKYEATNVVIEAAGAGIALIQQIRHEIFNMRHRPFDIQHEYPKEDKATRLMAESPEINAGRVFLPQKAPWLDDFRTELLNFPNGKHDDQVDSLTLLLRWDRYKYRYMYKNRRA